MGWSVERQPVLQRARIVCVRAGDFERIDWSASRAVWILSGSMDWFREYTAWPLVGKYRDAG